jgi:hypothetical protein
LYERALTTVLDDKNPDLGVIGEQLTRPATSVNLAEFANRATSALRWKEANPELTAEDWRALRSKSGMTRKEGERAQ